MRDSQITIPALRHIIWLSAGQGPYFVLGRLAADVDAHVAPGTHGERVDVSRIVAGPEREYAIAAHEATQALVYV